MNKRLLFFTVSLGGIGSVPKFSGTLGTLATMPFVWYLSQQSLALYLIVTAVLTAIAIAASSFYEKAFSKKDPKEVVIDEMAGTLVSFIGVSWSFPVALLGFFLFRFFDILKPFPVNWFEKNLKKGWAVVTDDLMAGVYTCVLLHLITRWFL